MSWRNRITKAAGYHGATSSSIYLQGFTKRSRQYNYFITAVELTSHTTRIPLNQGKKIFNDPKRDIPFLERMSMLWDQIIAEPQMPTALACSADTYAIPLTRLA